MGLTILTGCESARSFNAGTVLDKPLTEHAAALAGDDVNLMRRTGRVLIATVDALIGD